MNLLSKKLLDFEFCPELMDRRKNILKELNEEMSDVGGIGGEYAAGVLCGVCYHNGK
jgi:hypothetical protein